MPLPGAQDREAAAGAKTSAPTAAQALVHARDRCRCNQAGPRRPAPRDSELRANGVVPGQATPLQCCLGLASAYSRDGVGRGRAKGGLELTGVEGVQVIKSPRLVVAAKCVQRGPHSHHGVALSCPRAVGVLCRELRPRHCVSAGAGKCSQSVKPTQFVLCSAPGARRVPAARTWLRARQSRGQAPIRPCGSPDELGTTGSA